jgi:hypothetical protein
MNPDFDWWSCPRVSSQAFVGIIAKDNYPEGLPYAETYMGWLAEKIKDPKLEQARDLIREAHRFVQGG